MPCIIRDAEFKNQRGDGFWPGMWVHNDLWRHPRHGPTPVDACYLWRVEQHDGVMVLVGQGVDIVVPLSEEVIEHCDLFKHPQDISLADYPEEWAAIRKLGWGVCLYYQERLHAYQTHVRLQCHRGFRHEMFWLPDKLWYEVHSNPEIMRSFLRTAWWQLKHPKYAEALAHQQPEEFWHWPNTPDLKQLHKLGVAAWKTIEGKIEISPDGTLKATGRKRWELPLDDQSE